MGIAELPKLQQKTIAKNYYIMLKSEQDLTQESRNKPRAEDE